MEEELQILKEACQALAHLDAERLEELAATCRTLNRDLPQAGPRPQLPPRREDCLKQLKVLGRIVEGTQGNLAVIHRVQARVRGTYEANVFGRGSL